MAEKMTYLELKDSFNGLYILMMMPLIMMIGMDYRSRRIEINVDSHWSRVQTLDSINITGNVKSKRAMITMEVKYFNEIVANVTSTLDAYVENKIQKTNNYSHTLHLSIHFERDPIIFILFIMCNFATLSYLEIIYMYMNMYTVLIAYNCLSTIKSISLSEL